MQHLRQLADDYHQGQETALYAFAVAGTVINSAHAAALRDELDDALDLASSISAEDVSTLERFAAELDTLLG